MSELFGTTTAEPAEANPPGLDEEIAALEAMFQEASDIINNEATDDIQHQEYKKIRRTAEKRLDELYTERFNLANPDKAPPNIDDYKALLERVLKIGLKESWLEKALNSDARITSVDGVLTSISGWSRRNFENLAAELAHKEVEHAEKGAKAPRAPRKKTTEKKQELTFPPFGVGDYVLHTGYSETNQTRGIIQEVSEGPPAAVLVQLDDQTEPIWFDDLTVFELLAPTMVYQNILAWATEAGKTEQWVSARLGPLQYEMKIHPGKLTIPLLDALATKLYEDLVSETTEEADRTAGTATTELSTPPEDAPTQEDSTHSTTAENVAPLAEPEKPTAVNNSGLRVDPESGEILDLPWVLRKVGMTELPKQLTREQANEIGDVIATYQEQAKRYIENGQRLAAKPLAQAAAIKEQFDLLLFHFAEPQLPKAGNRAQYPGEVTALNLQLEKCRLNFYSAGGWEMADSKEYQAWKEQQYEAGKGALYGIEKKVEYSMGKPNVEKCLDGKLVVDGKKTKVIVPGWKHSTKRAIGLKSVE